MFIFVCSHVTLMNMAPSSRTCATASSSFCRPFFEFTRIFVGQLMKAMFLVAGGLSSTSPATRCFFRAGCSALPELLSSELPRLLAGGFCSTSPSTLCFSGQVDQHCYVRDCECRMCSCLSSKEKAEKDLSQMLRYEGQDGD